MIMSYPKCKAGRCPWWRVHTLRHVCVSPTLPLGACTTRPSAPPQLKAHSGLTRQEILLQTDGENEMEEKKRQTITAQFVLVNKIMPAGHQNSWYSRSDSCYDDYHVCVCVGQVLPMLLGPNVFTRTVKNLKTPTLWGPVNSSQYEKYVQINILKYVFIGNVTNSKQKFKGHKANYLRNCSQGLLSELKIP